MPLRVWKPPPMEPPPVHLYQPGEPLSLSQVVSLYWQLGDETTCDRDRKDRRRILESFVAFCKDALVGHCQRAHLLLFLKNNPQWKEAATIRRIVRCIQRPFNWAEDEGLITRSPFRRMKCKKSKRGRPMTLGERQAFLRGSSPEYRRFLIALWFTGARPGELRTLDKRELDLEIRRQAVQEKHKTATMREDQEPRVLILHPVVVKLLIWILRRQEGERIFLNQHGKPWSEWWLPTYFARRRKALGIPFDCKQYGARHAFGTNAVLRDVDLITLSELLGHTTLDMTRRYVHVAGKTAHLHKAVEKIFGAQQTP